MKQWDIKVGQYSKVKYLGCLDEAVSGEAMEKFQIILTTSCNLSIERIVFLTSEIKQRN